MWIPAGRLPALRICSVELMAPAEMNTEPAVVARERVALVSGVALLAAGLILVVAVLPSEYGVYSLCIGRTLGLTSMPAVK